MRCTLYCFLPYNVTKQYFANVPVLYEETIPTGCIQAGTIIIVIFQTNMYEINHIKIRLLIDISKASSMVRLGLEEFLDRYHSAAYPYSFGGKDKVKQHVRVKRKVLDNILSKSDTYTSFREFKIYHLSELMAKIIYGKLI